MEMPFQSEQRPTYTLTAGDKARLQAAFAEHLGTVQRFAGVPTASALPCRSEGVAPVADTPRRPSRFMPAPDQTGFHGLAVHKKKSTWALVRDAWRNATQHRAAKARGSK
jgi:hypothetical protein